MVCRILSTYKIVVTVMVESVVCKTVDIVVRAVTEETTVTEVVLVSVVVVVNVFMEVVQVDWASIHMHKVLMTLEASALSCDMRLSRLCVAVWAEEDDVVVIAWDEEEDDVVVIA